MKTVSPQPDFDRGQRTYSVSDERLREFGKLSWAERLRWVEESAQFVRLGQAAMKAQLHSDKASADLDALNQQESI